MIREGVIDTKHIIVDSKIGSSGAGSGSGTSHAMRAGVIVQTFRAQTYRRDRARAWRNCWRKNKHFNEPARSGRGSRYFMH